MGNEHGGGGQALVPVTAPAQLCVCVWKKELDIEEWKLLRRRSRAFGGSGSGEEAWWWGTRSCACDCAGAVVCVCLEERVGH